jgi:peptidoglycan/xylan/chitin deacetylase (PgdA/CDA1 family)
MIIPVRTPFFLPWLYPSLIWRIPTAEKIIFLTFDDGPVMGPTEFVLDELAKSKAQATFFCIGDNIRKHPSVFQRVIDEGHAIGNHTYHHLNGWKNPNDVYFENIRRCENEIGSKMPADENKKILFRPPYGRITRSQIAELSKYRIIMWDVLTHDYDKSLDAERCLKRSIAATRNGSIIVFHDSLKAEKNMTYVLPRYIDHFRNLGYEFKSIS